MASGGGQDWEVLQEVMDNAFHQRGDAYPQGSAEHKEAMEFIPKLARAMAARRRKAPVTWAPPQAREEGEGGGNALGLPEVYDPRYRVNVSVLADVAETKKAYHAAKRGSRAASIADAAGPDGLRAAMEHYRTMLAHYEDFRQKRAHAKLLKLRADQAALPIAPFEESIVSALADHPVIVLAGDTGCGKSTQLPQFLLRAGYSKIAVTQPRRISAMSLCRRVSYETLNEHGDEVAYQIRFDSSRGAGTKVTFMTEGILLRRLAGDPELRDFDCIVHERHLSTDFLLALLRAIAMQRPALRVVLMSATINVTAYSDYFGGVPIISVPGRLHPIKVAYLPPPPDRAGRDGGPSGRSREEANERVAKGGRRVTERISAGPYVNVLRRIDTEVPREERGDVLVFLSGMDDIGTVAEALEEYAAQTKRWVVLKLHSSLAVESQDRVFDVAEAGVRKVILSTNIAETSVTIDGIRFVVDSGRCKEMLYDAGGQVGSLQEGWVSRASAEQRKGRAGRTGPGVCYRLYSESDFHGFAQFNLPEIQRVRLESVVLQIKQLAGGGMDPRRFGFIDPPPLEGVEAAIGALKAAQALDERETLTPLGAILASLPVDIHIGKMLVLGCVLGCSEAVLTMAAALSVQSPFLRTSGSEASRRSEVESPEGDPFSLFQLFEQWIRVKNEQKAGQRQSSRKWCQQRGVEEQRLYEIAKLRRQFQDLLRSAGLTERHQAQSSGRGDDSEPAHWSRMGRGQDGRRRHDKRGAPPSSKSWLRSMRQRLDKQSRARRLLRATGAEEGGEEAEGGSGSSEEEGKEREARPRGGGPSAEALKQLDLELTVDVASLAAAATAEFTRGDICLLKFVMASALYPNLAVPAIGNMHRRETDMRFHLATGKDGALHPSSGLAGRARELDAACVVAFVEALETRALFLCNNTPMPALPALLLSASQVDTTLDASRMVVDRWLLLRVQGGDGPKVLLSVAKARRALSLLMSDKLRAAHRRAGESGSGLSAAERPDEGACVQGEAADYMEGLPSWIGLVAEAWGAPQGGGGAAAVAEQLAAAFMWPVCYTVERLAGSAAAAQYVQVELEEGAEPGPATGKEAVKAEGLPGGHRVAPWLYAGALRGVESELAAHAALPALRRHWSCPGCGDRLIANADDIAAHVKACEQASQLEPGVLERSYGGQQVATGGAAKAEERRLLEDWKPEEKLALSRARDPAPPQRGSSGWRGGAAPGPSGTGGVPRGEAPPPREVRREYYCHWCCTSLMLSAPEFLKHKQMHQRAGD
eukprot:jgi/Tetstr1/448577/TSEL_035826.t1